jgi:hypothetical protein
MLPYVQQMIRRFEMFTGGGIAGWSGVEMALTEGRKGGEMWDDLSVPYLQMFYIDAAMVDGARIRISTHQTDDIWGLTVSETAEKAGGESDWQGIYRERVLDYLPCGDIKDVEVATANGLIDRVSLSIGSSNLQLSSGEVYPDGDETFHVVMQDVSVLVQVDDAHPRQNKS